MSGSRWILALLGVLLLTQTAQAQDTLKKVGGESVRGTVTAMTSTEVTLERASGGTLVVPVVEIDRLEYDGEPPQLKLVRSSLGSGAYENALKSLDKIDATAVERAEIKADLDYYRALCAARLALGDADIRTAGKQVRKFVEDHATSYHLLPATEALGDLFVAVKEYDRAQEAYATLAKSPFPAYQMRAGVASGRALMAQQKFVEAQAAFDAVLATAPSGSEGDLADMQRHAATLGKAVCLAETSQVEAAIPLVKELIAKLPAEETDLHAQGYVTLGNCYRKQQNEANNALLAYLKVDVLYFNNPATHAEALYNLAILWNQVGRPERATEATLLLKERYENSPWARK